MALTLLAGGGVAGGIVGYGSHGDLGAVLGVPLGVVAGFVVTRVGFFLLAVVFKVLLGGPLFPPKGSSNDGLSGPEP